MSELALKFDKVSKNFIDAKSKLIILNNADFCLPPGKIAMLFGPSGTGKTTVLQLAGLLCKPDQGRILINGIECKNDKTSTQTRRKDIGFVYQFHHLLPELNMVENAMLPLLINGVTKKTAQEIAFNFLDKLGLFNMRFKSVQEASGGQRQRIAVIRAIICRPKLVIADEPTGNLDEKNANDVFDILIKLTSDINSALLIATHNTHFAPKADYTVNIDRGRLHKV